MWARKDSSPIIGNPHTWHLIMNQEGVLQYHTVEVCPIVWSKHCCVVASHTRSVWSVDPLIINEPSGENNTQRTYFNQRKVWKITTETWCPFNIALHLNVFMSQSRIVPSNDPLTRKEESLFSAQHSTWKKWVECLDITHILLMFWQNCSAFPGFNIPYSKSLVRWSTGKCLIVMR